MSQVEFQEESDYSTNLNSEKTIGLVGLLIKFRITENEETAYKILIGIGIISVILTIIILWPNKTHKNNINGYTEEELINI